LIVGSIYNLKQSFNGKPQATVFDDMQAQSPSACR